jgi:signal transduction histidine kinase
VVWLTAAPGPALTIADDGAGISAGNRRHVFEPFFTTRRDSGGTGMGLTIVQGLLAAQGAVINLQDSPSGTSFRIDF